MCEQTLEGYETVGQAFPEGAPASAKVLRQMCVGIFEEWHAGQYG